MRPQCLVGDGECTEIGYPRYDRHGIYSGRACDLHAPQLPGQGDQWDYQPEPGEAIEPEDDSWDIDEGLHGAQGRGPDAEDFDEAAELRDHARAEGEAHAQELREGETPGQRGAR